jgi:hypothetical protein
MSEEQVVFKRNVKIKNTADLSFNYDIYKYNSAFSWRWVLKKVVK